MLEDAPCWKIIAAGLFRQGDKDLGQSAIIVIPFRDPNAERKWALVKKVQVWTEGKEVCRS